MWRILYCYLRIALILGHHEYVHELSNHWALSQALGCWRYYQAEAAWEIQKDLLHYGYFQCPGCAWATKVEGEHLLTGDGFCYEQTIQTSECGDEPELAE
jgi:hypothetical protein